MAIIPGYTLIEAIHQGEDVVLHRGRRDADQAPVLLELPRDEHPSPRLLARLRHAYAIARALRLPGVVAAEDLVKVDHSLALVLEDFGGRPLRRVVSERRLDLESLLRVAISIAGTLAAVHQRGVVHRDIKPENIHFCRETGLGKLTGFGIAERPSREPPPEGSRSMEGSLVYMSPEQTGRMNRAVDRRSDLYSLGVTLYELLAGAPPFQANDPVELVHSHIARVPPPLHARAPDVPEQVSAVVMKLLEKEPEDRYQSGSGLEADLEQCLSRWTATGRIDGFPLGAEDAGDLRLPDKLYGRDAELSTVQAAFARVAEGAPCAVIVAGGAGTGKSSLVDAARQAVAQKGGYVGWAKLDRIEQGAPYAALSRAFHDLVRRMLSEPAPTLERFRDRLSAAAGPNGQILVELVPDLALILGPQPGPPELGPAESQNRLVLLLQSFVRAFDRPIALFFDDLQWADGPSLKLVQALLADPERPRLLLVGACQDEEAGEDRADALAPPGSSGARTRRADLTSELRAHGVAVAEITLRELDRETVGELVAHALGSSASRATTLAGVIHEATGGNPAVVGQLLRTIQAEGALTFDHREKRWTWDASRIEQLAIDADITGADTRRLAALAPATRQALALASCIGPELSLRTLASVAGVSPDVIEMDLWEALGEGLLAPLDPERRAPSAGDSMPPPADQAAAGVRFVFLRDGARQAAYALIDADRARAIHLQIGRILLDEVGGAPPDAELFEIVRQKNLGAALITEPAERLSLARLNLLAGKKAKAKAAYAPASGYLQAGVALLSPSAWSDGYELTFELHMEQAECDLLEGRAEQAEARFEQLSTRARSPSERARVCEQRVALCARLGRFRDALRVAREGLAERGIDLPETIEGVEAALEVARAEAEAALGSRSIDDLARAPAIADPDARAAIRLLNATLAPAYLDDPRRWMLVSTLQTVLHLKHGRSELDAFCYVTYAFLLQVAGRDERARAFWELADALNEAPGPLDLKCKTSNALASTVHLLQPLRAALVHTERSYERGRQAGELTFASYAANTAIMIRLAAGDPLDVVHAEAARFEVFTRKSRELMCNLVQTVARQLAACLMGRTRGALTLTDDACDEAELAARLDAAGIPFASCWYHTAKLVIAVLLDEPARGAESAAEAERLEGAAAGIQFSYDLPFYLGVMLAARHEGATPAERGDIAAKLAEHSAALARSAARCGASYGAKSLLLAAEVARVSGDGGASRELFDRAIAAAREAEMLHVEALASERCARFYFGRGQDKLAAVYLKDAHHAYLLWGAAPKAAALAARYPEILAPAAAPDRAGAPASTAGRAGKELDTLALVRAAQAITGELALERLVESLLRAALESAGARRGVLLLAREDDLHVVAKLALDPDRLEANLSVPLAESGDVAASIVQLVARTTTAVVVGDAAHDIRFAGDPYLLTTRARSILCLAMKHKSELAGVLFLENEVASEAFTPDRVELCALFASQAAIAVENAVLVADIQRRTEALREANEVLERELAERTALERELVLVQTPLIPITDRVVVMPIIGTITAARAEQILEAALRGAQERRATAVILDVTGVAQLGGEIAGMLVSTARALRLLGAEAILTGIHPAVARSLVEIGADLGAVVTRGTLQAGIAYAVGQPGRGERRA